MKYKGKELREANGADYPLGRTPKTMLVWDDSDDDPVEREVLGYYNGRWVAGDICGVGVCTWIYAAEIPEEPERKWRPFKDMDEFIRAAGGLSSIWIKRKTDGLLQLVLAGDPNDDTSTICVNSAWVSFNALFEQFTFLDGTPCGVEEDA